VSDELKIVVWRNLYMDVIEVSSKLISPKFLFISIAMLIVSTCGIWIGPLFLSDSSQVSFSIFSFVVATLGVLAAESLVRANDKEASSLDKYRQEVKVSLMILLWVVAFVLSFLGLRIAAEIQLGLIASLVITIILWLVITVNKSEFNLPLHTPDQQLNAALNTSRESLVESDDEPGDGLNG
jgi:hypothetical protein